MKKSLGHVKRVSTVYLGMLIIIPFLLGMCISFYFECGKYTVLVWCLVGIFAFGVEWFLWNLLQRRIFIKCAEVALLEEKLYHPDYLAEGITAKLAIDTKQKMVGIITVNAPFAYQWFSTADIEQITVHIPDAKNTDTNKKTNDDIYYAFMVNGKKVKMFTNEEDAFWNHLRNYHCRQKHLKVEELDLTPQQKRKLACESARKQARILAGYAGYFDEIPEE